MIEVIADRIWSIIQRPSPAIRKDEILEILREELGAPSADETPPAPVFGDFEYAVSDAGVITRTPRAKDSHIVASAILDVLKGPAPGAVKPLDPPMVAVSDELRRDVFIGAGGVSFDVNPNIKGDSINIYGTTYHIKHVDLD
jgi:hypothetical protein